MDGYKLSKRLGMWATVITCFLLTACTEQPTVPIASEATIRHIPQGTLIGLEGEYNSHIWRGIPFAKAPIGALRWKAAQSAHAFHEDVFHALEHGAACTQMAGVIGAVAGEKGTVGGQEDCLYLSVYAPALSLSEIQSKQTQLPVMLWIHGGANKSGAGAMYDGARLAAQQNVIVVSINYRLGPFGWFTHPALNHSNRQTQTNEQALNASGNFGTLDIIQSLKWVQENIAGFGGDADNVTVFGESAGGFNTISLMLSPLAKGLFHKAISQSGGLHTSSLETATNYIEDGGDKYSALQAELYAHQLISTKAPTKAQIAAQPDKQRATFLMNLSTQEVMDAYRFNSDATWLLNPDLFADGVVIPKGDPAELFKNPNTHNNVAFIAGTNRDENKLYLFTHPELVTTYLGFYYVVKDQNRYNAFAQYPSEMWKYNGVDRLAAALSESIPGKVWAYRFDWDEQARPVGIKIDKLIGAGHGMEIPFVFGFTDKSDTWNQMYNDDNLASREALSLRMRNYWAAFAHYGTPGKGLDEKGEYWAPWNNNSADKFIVFDSKTDGGIRMQSDIITPDGIEKRLVSDARLPANEDKCRVLAGLVKADDAHWPESEYPKKLEGACADYPL